MGRGIGYKYDHFLLIDEGEFTIYPPIIDENGEETEEIDYSSGEFDEVAFEEFKSNVTEAFGAIELCKTVSAGREAYYFAEDDRFKLGLDCSGDTHCIFLEANEYEIWNSPYNYREYKIDRDAKRGFNKLIKIYGGNFFRRPTSAWTSEPIVKYA